MSRKISIAVLEAVKAKLHKLPVLSPGAYGLVGANAHSQRDNRLCRAPRGSLVNSQKTKKTNPSELGWVGGALPQRWLHKPGLQSLVAFRKVSGKTEGSPAWKVVCVEAAYESQVLPTSTVGNSQGARQGEGT